MSNMESLRSLYPTILSITRADMDRLRAELAGDPAVEAWLTSKYFDVQRARKRSGFEGWAYQNNPFTSMDLSEWGPLIPDDVLDATHEMIVRAYSWLGIGSWHLAEEYFKVALSLAFVSNNVMAALQVGANLGMCYLGGKDYDNALRVIEQAFPASIKTSNWNTAHRMGTIKRMCYASTGQWRLVKDETQKLKRITNEASLASLDRAVFDTIEDILSFIRDSQNLQAWRKTWDELERRIR